MKSLPKAAWTVRVLAIKLAAFGALSLVAGFGGDALAFDLDPNEIRGKSSKKPVTVLQNRYFLKAWRPEAGFVVGSVLDEAYLSSTVYGARAGLFFNEWLGMEVQMLRTSVKDSDDRKALNKLEYCPKTGCTTQNDAVPGGVEERITVTPDPEVNAIHGITDFHAVAAPFYGKLNLADQLIIYTDLYLTGGMARVETDQGDKTAITLGVGERFYIGKAWSVRVDFKDRIYSEQRAGEETRKHSMTVDFGASYFFN